MTKTLFKVPVGDWSQDGHNQYQDFYVYCNYPVKVMRQAYKDTCGKIGLQMNCSKNYTGIEDLPFRNWRYLLVECEESSICEEAVDILSKHGFSFNNIHVEDKGICFSESDVLDLFMWFISYSMPADFEWEEFKIEAEPIVGYWNKELNHQIGYGVFC
ncbi:hypothetical protein P9Z59_13555 [Bacillus thuringiensis]|uniref:Uncharacterized protein n=1 Tax=Bacillus thuringiensis subsp. tolworthi TaxID=1442 RepID=A0A9W3ZZM5_BACTO|nr:MULTISPECIES: hypothetical protein [Bacillus cereus group]KAB1367986.1 hypothetical protein FPG89_25170 [Bacillus thuringiensis]KIP23244.1 hypothetical protein BG10_4143 [Bacillus thuringiensis serovar morrisoni]MCT6947819.1 hypothetical protein [Bacillus thuringiensis]MDA2524984.1 hypothetical protein [Bacillus cereus]MDA2560900.1 hypothetical protein [Bacillus cereus]